MDFSLVQKCLVLLFLAEIAQCQFPNLYGGMMGSQTGNKKPGNGTTCENNAVSCLPWCARVADANGCYSCNCNSGINPMAGMNPMAGTNPMTGMNPMTGFNPMAGMYSGLSGGQSPMTGGGPRQGLDCAQVPRTCPFPQPWCQRVADNNGCVKCLCGNELTEFMQKFSGQTQPTDGMTTTTTSTMKTGSTRMITSRMTTSTQPNSMSCLLNFYCTKTCDNGYKTDNNNCPVCECIDGGLIDTPVDATDPPGKHAAKTTSLPTPIVTNHVTSCPGIFDCGLICNSGYKTDAMGCPVCECMSN